MNHLDTLCIHILWDEVSHGLGCSWGYLTRLQNNTVSSSYGWENRGQGEVEREVPGTHHQHYTIGLGVHEDSVKQSHGTLLNKPIGEHPLSQFA